MRKVAAGEFKASARARLGMPSADVLVLDTHIWLDVALGRERGLSALLSRVD
jgi:hypothetical protein